MVPSRPISTINRFSRTTSHSLGLLALSCSCLLDVGLRRSRCSLSGTRSRFDRTEKLTDPWHLSGCSFEHENGASTSTLSNSTKNLSLPPHSFFLSFCHRKKISHNVNPYSSSSENYFELTFERSAAPAPKPVLLFIVTT